LRDTRAAGPDYHDLLPALFSATLFLTMNKEWKEFLFDIGSWSRGWHLYIERHVVRFGIGFEARKDTVVDFLLARRGTYQWPFLHLSLVILLITGVLSAPIVASAYPGSANELTSETPPSAVLSTLDLAQTVQTQISEKPRDKVELYTAKEGDTISSIADSMGISVDTIKWENDIKKDSLTIGQQLKIPPVTGIVHKVREGDTVYTIAKKYRTDAQNIVNFPFNDFADQDTFALNVGQDLIVPEGIQPEAPAIVVPRGPVFALGQGTGRLLWPTSGGVTQYPSWYHMGLDISDNSAPGIAAADSGTVILVEYLRYSYGFHVIIDHGNGLSTLYGHMQAIYVKPGDRVARGQIIGKMGSTGRSTGTHLHFEVRNGGIAVNPLPYIK
jgi:murein DD-endopeptidase MepM/ murein hydrolase activator NlpD